MRSEYRGYEDVPPFGKPENGGAKPQDTYGNPDYPHGYEPGYHLLPVPPATWGLSTEQQLHALGKKVDELIDTFNAYDRKIHGAHEEIVNSALCNDAYYKEITVEDGYIGETGAKYKVVHIPYLDRAGQPIFLELGLPSNSTVNEGLTENCFDASQRTLADKLIPAVDAGTGYTGLTLYKGQPIANAPMPISQPEGSSGWTLGVTESGWLKVYDTANSSYENMKWDRVRNAMGVKGLLVLNGSKAKDDFMPSDKAKTVARTAIGMCYQTKERFIVTVNGDDEHGCLSSQLADIFVKYKCDVAAEVASQGSSFAMDKGELMFMPPTADISLAADGQPNAPHAGAFWYITKRRHYRNEYVKDVATLMQRLGQDIWTEKIYSKSVDSIEEGLQKVELALEKETEERIKGDSGFQEQLDAEKKTRQDVDNDLYAELHKLENDSANGDSSLRTELLAKIEQRVADLKKFIQSEDSKITKELHDYITQVGNYEVESVQTSIEGSKRTYRLIRHDGSSVEVPIEVYDYTSLSTGLADVLAATEMLNAFKTEYEAWKTSVDDAVRALKTADTQFGARLDSAESDLANMKGTFAQIQERMSALDRTVSSFQSQITQMELTCENLKTAWAEYHAQWLEAKTQYEQWQPEVEKRIAALEAKAEAHDADIADIKPRLETAETGIVDLKKDQARQDTAWEAASQYTNSRIQDLVEESSTYWQKFDQFEAKVREDQTLNLKRLNAAEEDRADLWKQSDANLASVNELKEQALKDNIEFAALKLKADTLASEAESHDARIEALEDGQVKADGKISSLETTVSEMGDRQDTLDTHLNSLDERCDRLEQTDGTLKQADEELKQADAQLKLADEALDERIKAIEDGKTSDDEKETAQNGRIEALEGQQTVLSGQISGLEEELHAINVDSYVLKAGDVMTGKLAAPAFQTDTVGELTEDGGRLKIQAKDSTEAVRMAGADGVEDDEFVTKKQVTEAFAAAGSEVTDRVTALEAHDTETDASINALQNEAYWGKETDNVILHPLLMPKHSLLGAGVRIETGGYIIHQDAGTSIQDNVYGCGILLGGNNIDNAPEGKTALGCWYVSNDDRTSAIMAAPFAVGTPVSALHATTKKYVDNAIAKITAKSTIGYNTGTASESADYEMYNTGSNLDGLPSGWTSYESENYLAIGTNLIIALNDAEVSDGEAWFGWATADPKLWKDGTAAGFVSYKIDAISNTGSTFIVPIPHWQYINEAGASLEIKYNFVIFGMGKPNNLDFNIFPTVYCNNVNETWKCRGVDITVNVVKIS